MLKTIIKSTALVGLLMGTVQAVDIEVRLVNNMATSHFTPLLVAAHPSTAHIFIPGMPASVA